MSSPESTARSESPLIAVVGATGTGKSALTLQLAEHLSERDILAEIVNADAMQLYRGMDIGTAKLSQSDRRRYPHHLFDTLAVTEDASVARYQSDALAVIAAIRTRGATPIIAGGSGLYMSSVLFDFQFPGTDAAIRDRLEGELEDQGPGILFARLTTADPVAATAIGPHNGRRIVRALEVIELTGKPFGAGLPDETRLRSPTHIIGLAEDRANLVHRLDLRVERMWADGIIEETRALLPLGLAESVTASRAIGYAQAIAQLAGRMSESEAIAQTQSLTRKFARRQVGWFRRYPNVTWVPSGHPDGLEQAIATMVT